MVSLEVLWIWTRQSLTLYAAQHRPQGRTALIHDSVSELVGWLEEVDTDPFLVVVLQTFLLGRGELTTISLPHDAPSPSLCAYELVSQQEQVYPLGFDNLVVEGVYHQF